ncbi:hypothetical protein BTUL_0085g00340 [Botrytis tulipae]|uniref:Heterokaryon incompatibility domain-containing protein n=1 Tax=Botrytis tulipae TaxID=87230 RepID=A0A4Z1EQF0_9HELO|nr:hypothetical protein BTUL_0085g00340 [Botrytis tulipae]
MSTSQLQARYSVEDYFALPEEDQHHLDALEHAGAVDLTEPGSLELSTPLPEKVKTQNLCHYCQPMFSTIENLKSLTSKKGYKHNTITGVREAAGRGCGSCKFIQTCYLRSKTGNSHMRVHACLVENKIEDRLLISKGKSMFIKEHLLPRLRESTMSTKYPFDGCKLDGLTIDFPGCPVNRLCLLSDEGSRAGVYIERQPPVAKGNFERTIPQIKKWLDDCCWRHTRLCQYSTPKLPTRVLQIGSKNTSLVRLHVSRPDQKDDYIALSYCWGGPQSFTTTNSTLEYNMRGFDTDNLPLTFKDTIFIARKLGIRYIWIDALCIIQDSNVDKDKEIEAMGDIYKNATVTISAASASSVDGGLFDHGPTPNFLEVPFCLPDKSLSQVYMSRQIAYHESDDPVNHRAWCFQESMLSPRLLSFRSTELLWHCQSLAYEPVAKSNRRYIQSKALVPANIFGRNMEIQIPGVLHRARAWNSIVETFTERSLTNSEDRLPAISAIAKELAFVWNDEHVFGVMRSTVERHLSWAVVHRYGLDKKHEIARNDRAPSWSWVSIDCQVRITMPASHFHVRTKCLEIDNTPACGKIVLHARVLSLEAHLMNSRQEKLLQKYYDVAEDLEAKACTLMLLGEYEIGDKKDFGCSLSFLILKRLSNGYYQRVGLFDCWLQGRYPLHDWMRPKTLRKLLKTIDFSRVTIV